ncbi:MAG: 50S ribosomal protein L35 [Endomicrobium sp.]|jgi:large subunit ribosomal protein L35|nr:50S ribosomal protein L35 [Endomicrobium sp.]
MKTHSGAKKRFKITKNNHVKCKKSGQRHLLVGDSGNQNRIARKPIVLSKSNIKIIKFLMPYQF